MVFPDQPISAFLLDRDGTINKDIGYLHNPKDFEFLPGALDALSLINKLHIPIFIITNQSGIGVGLYTWDDFHRVTEFMIDICRSHQINIDGVYASPYHPDGKGEFRHSNHPDRKPNPGMILRAALEHRFDLKHAWMIGDRSVDVEAGIRAGTHTCQVLCGIDNGEVHSNAELISPNLHSAIVSITKGL